MQDLPADEKTKNEKVLLLYKRIKSFFFDPRIILVLQVLLLVISAALLLAWLAQTPPGLLGKADAVGFAVCHRISERSFFLAERQSPLCARCTGMYLGALIGLLYQLRLGKRGGFPAFKISAVLFALLTAFAIDGVNSYVGFFPNIPRLYPSQNYLRLLTGTGLGIGMAAILLPVFHQTLWREWENRPALSTWRQLIELLIIAAVVDVAVLSENPLVLYPLSLLGSATILVILSMVYTMIWTMLFRRENAFSSPRHAWQFLLLGFDTALLQIALMDLGRYTLTGGWGSIL